MHFKNQKKKIGKNSSMSDINFEIVKVEIEKSSEAKKNSKKAIGDDPSYCSIFFYFAKV